MRKPLVSVIMNCFNGEKYLHEAIKTVFAQTYTNWEIVFWDNCSTDQSAEIAKSYGERVRYFKSDKTTTLGAARNKAFSVSRGEFIAFLDTDDLWMPEKLEKQIPLFESNETLGLVFCDTIYFDENGDNWRSFNFAAPKRSKVFADLLMCNFISTVSMVYKRTAMESLSYVYDDEYRLVPDHDLALRVAYHFELDYVDFPLTKWRMHSGSETSRKKFLRPVETKSLIDKLGKNLPDFHSKYKEEADFFFKQANCLLALEQWMNGNLSGARGILKLYWRDPKCLIVFFGTWILTYATFEKLKLGITDKLRRLYWRYKY